MLKPFFTNPFKSLATRTGVPIGHAGERGMLDALGGSDGFRKRYQLNADGSMTMLKTKNGMPRFITEGGANQLVITVSSESCADVFGSTFVTHTISVSQPTAILNWWFVDIAATGGINYDNTPVDADLSDGVTVSAGTFVIPPGVLSFTITVQFVYNSANILGHDLDYRLHASNGLVQGSGIGRMSPI